VLAGFRGGGASVGGSSVEVSGAQAWRRWQVAGEHGDRHVGPNAFFQTAEDGPQVQLVGLDVPEVPLDVSEVLVGGDHGRAVQFAGRDGGRST
jgi:hypothetical protein